MHAASTIRFSGALEKAGGSPAILPLPRTARVTLPEGGEVTVEGVINTYPFQAVLEAAGARGLRLRVSRIMLAGAHAHVGDVAAVELTRVGKELETRVPAELRSALAAAPRARAMWEKTTPLARRDWVLWIITGKLAETRRIRVAKGCDMLASGKRRICCFPGLNWLMKAGASSRKRSRTR